MLLPQGLLGANFGPQLMTAAGFKDTIARGLAIAGTAGTRALRAMQRHFTVTAHNPHVEESGLFHSHMHLPTQTTTHTLCPCAHRATPHDPHPTTLNPVPLPLQAAWAPPA